jgi:hypothetical protein
MEHARTSRPPIPSWRRSEYLDIIASALAGVRDPGDGTVYKAARTAQQKILYGGRRCDDPVLAALSAKLFSLA